jgi:hypothetical protein
VLVKLRENVYMYMKKLGGIVIKEFLKIKFSPPNKGPMKFFTSLS